MPACATPPAPDCRRHTAGARLRYFHVDGGHDPNILAHDLELAAAVTAADGIICLDDMLHSIYPELPAITGPFLTAHPEWRVFCITDRADPFAVSKYFLCHPHRLAAAQDTLREPFAHAYAPPQPLRRLRRLDPREGPCTRPLLCSAHEPLRGHPTRHSATTAMKARTG